MRVMSGKKYIYTTIQPEDGCEQIIFFKSQSILEGGGGVNEKT